MFGDSEEDTVKVIIVGDGFAGKTSLLRRFVRGDFIDQYKKTIGAEFLEKDVFLRNSNSTVKLMLWDTAGQEVFNALTQAYYRGAGAAVLVFSTVDRESFNNVGSWKDRVEAVCGPITMVLCQSKFDLSHEAAITNEEAEELAKRLKIPFYRVSSKDDFNVTQLFEFTAQHCLNGSSGEAGGAADGKDTDGPAAAAPAATATATPAVPLREEDVNAVDGSKATGTEPTAPSAHTGENGSTLPLGGADAADGNTGAQQPPAAAAAAGSAAATATASGAGAATATAPTAPTGKPKDQASKKEENPRKVSLNEPETAAALDGKTKKKKKKRCTLL